MKKLLAVSSLVVSMSVITPVYAETFSASATAAGGAAEVAAEGAAVAIGAGAATAGTAGVAAGVVTAKVMNERLFTNCPAENQAACDAAQVGTWTGAGVGSAGVLAIVATCGADAAGLAALGATVGGGLLTGIATVVIAPVAVAAAGGYAAYYWWPEDGLGSLLGESEAPTPIPAPVN